MNPSHRVEAPAKVTGAALYAAEGPVDNLCYGVVVSGTITRGTIESLDLSEAKAVNGVIDIFHYDNRPDLPWFSKKYKDEDAPPGSPYRYFYDNKIRYNQQPVALVVAETFEAARQAASLVKVFYDAGHFETDIHKNKKFAEHIIKKRMNTPGAKDKGDVKKALKLAEFKVETEYFTEAEHHSPMELFATTVICEDDGSLTIHDKTQGVANSQTYVCNIFGLEKKKVTVKAPYVGGAFGSALRPNWPLFMATLAATELKRSVRVSMTRQQTFGIGHRPSAFHNINLACDSDGKLKALQHKSVQETSRDENYTENLVHWGGLLYPCPNVSTDWKLARIDMFTPLDMRAPGAASAVSAFEAAMDELAVAADIDPLEFRKINYGQRDEIDKKDFTSKQLMACYVQGAEKFGWEKRPKTPRSRREGHELIGYGMATGIWEALIQKNTVRLKLTKKGELTVESMFTDIGTGTYTIAAMKAASELGIEQEKVSVKLGDTDKPAAPLQGGSWTAASVMSSIEVAMKELKKQIVKLPSSPFKERDLEKLTFKDGVIIHQDGRLVELKKLFKEIDKDLCAEGTFEPNKATGLKYAMNTHSAVFVEVAVDEDFGMVTVRRVVSAIAGGKIINPTTARSQIVGGVVWGISMALHEKSLIDHDAGRVMNHSLAEYHVPVNKDIKDIDVIFVHEEDKLVNPMGVKGLGEIGIVGVAGAIANAIFNATGKRIREFPITLDKLL